MNKKNTIKSFWNDESGDVSIKGLAITVAILVLVGLALVFIRGNLDGWIQDIWDRFMEMIDKMVS